MDDYIVSRSFPLHHIQDGAVLGNSYLGVLVWGGKNTLNISLGSSALWDHRGGVTWTTEHSLHNIRSTVLSKDIEKMHRLFHNPHKRRQGLESPPVIVPAGRIEVKLKKSCRFSDFQLNLSNARLEINYLCGKEKRSGTIILDMIRKGSLGMRCSDIASFKVLDSVSLSCGKLTEAGIPAPQRFKNARISGFINELPADPAYGIAAGYRNDLLSIYFDRDKKPEFLKERLLNMPDFKWKTVEKILAEYTGNPPRQPGIGRTLPLWTL